MVNVSKKELPQQTHDDLMRGLVELVGYPATRVARKNLINQFFTDSERELFAKRIAIILMLQNDVAPSSIAEEICVSPSTVAVYQKKLNEGAYTSITDALAHIQKDGGLSNIVTMLFNFPQARKNMKKQLNADMKSIGARIGTR